MPICIKCGKPAAVEQECWNCEGRGRTLPLGAYVAHRCRECRGSGKLVLCADCAKPNNQRVRA